MTQHWHDLTFVHWALSPAVVAEKLPAGLVPDTWEGQAYLSLVPFTMTGVRAPWEPSWRWLTDFHEWNLRTYVKSANGTPGVWFFSLEASNPLAVLAARAWYKLPYHFARMSLSREGGRRTYTSARRWPGPAAGASRVVSEPLGPPAPAAAGTLDFWLVERYLLFAAGAGRMCSGQVHHAPYTVSAARLVEFDVDIPRAEGFAELGDPLPLVHYSPGVSVEVFSLARCD
jgi:uncharacterized protein YqjF (DUF2071 family)